VLAAAAPASRRACTPDPALSHRHACQPAAVNAGHFHPTPAAARRPAAAGYPLACQPSPTPAASREWPTVTNKACADGSKAPISS